MKGRAASATAADFDAREAGAVGDLDARPAAGVGEREAAPKPAATDWTRRRERGSRLAIRAMRFVVLAFGRRAARLLLHPIALWYAMFGGDVGRHSRRYLARALGRPASGRDVYRHLHSFLATVLDRAWFLQERFDLFEVEASGIETILEPFRRGEGVLACGAHFGSFEALRMIGHRHGLRVAMIMYEDNARMINEALAAFAPTPRAGDGPVAPPLRTIALGRLDAMIELRRWLDGGGIAGMLGDRSVPTAGPRDKTVMVDFLGVPAPFPDGPFRLAALLRRKVVFMAGIYRGGHRYEMRFADIADFASPPASAAERDAAIRAAVVAYARTLEALCREAPYNFFNFHDFWAEDDARR